ncbi:Ribonuclease H2 subunit A [Vanrija pseudolonga]|uniref:Ribonuclease n=1 Tax=Vanrija pseudolonga TaxID=143232 RepID=A0AAF0Y9K7_9TREE|nr:Ribonuclease H2 subunit A [Vanrija pseudolonga]
MTDTTPVDPVDLDPIPALVDSYVFHSTLPDDATASTDANKQGWIMGIDEAGRGPVLGPMVYAAAYCPLVFKPTLEGIGFDDSKALSAETRQALWDAFKDNNDLCYSSATLSPQAISANMLRRVPVNLNRQAEEATMGLVQAALDRGLNIKECYVDALGPSQQWQDRLSLAFPSISFTVCPKADSIYKIVGAASIIAKVTRDRYIENWVDAEGPVANGGDEDVIRGSGYPSDPKTQAYLRNSIDPVFGYRGIVRFSWATVKVLLEKQAAPCAWADDVTQPSAASYFNADADRGQPKVWRQLGVSSVGEL